LEDFNVGSVKTLLKGTDWSNRIVDVDRRNLIDLI
jgi:hypothetical protein